MIKRYIDKKVKERVSEIYKDLYSLKVVYAEYYISKEFPPTMSIGDNVKYCGNTYIVINVFKNVDKHYMVNMVMRGCMVKENASSLYKYELLCLKTKQKLFINENQLTSHTIKK